jgi:MFS family permease
MPAGRAAALSPVTGVRGGAGYSLWSNRSFKAPVVAGAVACLLGNILYCFSYDARALWMLVLSRFVMGFGAGPRWGRPAAPRATLRPRRAAGGCRTSAAGTAS